MNSILTMLIVGLYDFFFDVFISTGSKLGLGFWDLFAIDFSCIC